MNIIQDLCFPHQSFENSDEVFHFIAPILINKKFVTEDFENQLKIRERSNPTGFDLEYMGIAIPHVDAQYVQQDGLWIMTFKEPCDWTNAETNEKLKISIIFGLLISNPHSHIDMLQKLTNIFPQISIIQELSQIDNSSELCNMIGKILK